MRLFGLLLTLSLVLAEENDIDICDICNETKTTILQMDSKAVINSSFSEIQCFIYNANLLSCSWSTVSEDAQYSASFQHCYTQEHPLSCTSEKTKKLVKCQGLIQSDEDMTVKINISINGSWYVICKYYIPETIEKLDPPQNITTSIKSANLEIQWVQPGSCCSMKNTCFFYELKIDNGVKNENVTLVGELAYKKTNFEPTRRYSIQMRTKLVETCGNNDHWSEWSKEVVVGPSGNVYQLNASVIASIAFVLPMILLAFLLVCKFHRVFEKLFPAIPNPSKNVQKLLEKNENFNQVTPPKQSEEGAEILEVIFTNIDLEHRH